MIVLDPPVDYFGKFKRCSHMISTLVGASGSDELLTFAVQIGMRPEWLQNPGGPSEHFDVFGNRRARAILAGAAELDRLAFINAIRAKRGDRPLERHA